MAKESIVQVCKLGGSYEKKKICGKDSSSAVNGWLYWYYRGDGNFEAVDIVVNAENLEKENEESQDMEEMLSQTDSIDLQMK